MSLPIIDINAGDTMSAMVDKVNYNFTLLSLKGGGAQGLQGIQGIRGPVGDPGERGPMGPNGASIYNVDPTDSSLDPTPYENGDIFIYGGIIYQLNNKTLWEDDHSQGLSLVVDLPLSVQSPFTKGTSTNTINPQNSFSTYPFVLGVSADSALNTTIMGNQQSKMFIEGGGGNCISFCNNGTSIGTISCSGSNMALASTGSLNLNGPTNGGIMHSIQINSNGVQFPDRANLSTSLQNTSYILMATKNDSNALLDTTKNDVWGIERISSSHNALFPSRQTCHTNEIGLRTSDTFRIDTIYLNRTSRVRIDSRAITNNSTLVTYATISADAATTGSDSPGTDIMLLSKYGVALGGLKSTNSMYKDFDKSSFTIKLSTPENLFMSTDVRYGTKVTIASNTGKTSSIVAQTNFVNTSSSSELSFVNGASWKFSSRISLANGVDKDIFMRDAYCNLIVADKQNNNNDKNPNDILHIHGADGVSSTGCDVVLSGGNVVNNDINVNHVGGDVYISGGAVFMEDNNQIKNDYLRYGNVVIGINPMHHQSCFNPAVYNSTNDDRIAATNPEDVKFFDVNNVAMHGNKIVIDSNANYRKMTDGYTKNTNGSTKNWKPFVEEPSEATFQLSCVNTMNHTEPIVIPKKEICSHQFMSGVMRRIIRMQVSNGEVITSFVNPNTFFSSSETYTKNDTNGSAYFITEQVWQKVGNIVNVNAFGRWVANCSKEDDSSLYHITDYMFANSDKIIDSYWYGIPAHSLTTVFYNNILKKWMLFADNTSSTTPFSYRNWQTGNNMHMDGQPLTVFALPVSVENMRSTFCYGNGNVYTENACTTLNGEAYEPSGSVLMSAPVTVGAYHSPYLDNLNSSQIDDRFYVGRTKGDNSMLHGYNYNNALMANMNNNGKAQYDFMSTTVTNSDSRSTLSSNTNGEWNEKRFVRTEMFNNDNWCYIYPEMIASWQNGMKYTTNTTFYRYSERLRPCVGLYTWISLNYSYSVMDGFGLGDTNGVSGNHIPPMAYRDFNSSSSTQENSQFIEIG